MTTFVIICQAVLAVSYLRVIWAFRREGIAVTRRNGRLTAAGAYWWFALSAIVFPIRWWFVPSVMVVQSNGQVATWAALNLACALMGQLLFGAIRDERR